MSKYNYLFTSSHFVMGALHLGGFPKLLFFSFERKFRFLFWGDFFFRCQLCFI